MTAIWPTTLPSALLLQGLSYAFGDDTLRTDMEVGPLKSRPRSSMAYPSVRGTVRLTGTQLATLATLYNTTLTGGALPFSWTDPTTGTTISYLFMAAPSVTPIRADGAVHKREWLVGLDLKRVA